MIYVHNQKNWIGDSIAVFDYKNDSKQNTLSKFQLRVAYRRASFFQTSQDLVNITC